MKNAFKTFLTKKVDYDAFSLNLWILNIQAELDQGAKITQEQRKSILLIETKLLIMFYRKYLKIMISAQI